MYCTGCVPPNQGGLQELHKTQSLRPSQIFPSEKSLNQVINLEIEYIFYNLHEIKSCSDWRVSVEMKRIFNCWMNCLVKLCQASGGEGFESTSGLNSLINILQLSLQLMIDWKQKCHPSFDNIWYIWQTSASEGRKRVFGQQSKKNWKPGPLGRGCCNFLSSNPPAVCQDWGKGRGVVVKPILAMPGFWQLLFKATPPLVDLGLWWIIPSPRTLVGKSGWWWTSPDRLLFWAKFGGFLSAFCEMQFWNWN